jgi:hypothetical protein
MKRPLLALSFITAFSVFAAGQAMTALAAGNANARGGTITLSPPYACTLSKQHPCVYYGGDLDPNDPEGGGVSNENTLFIQNSWTYNEVNSPVSAKVSAAFTNNLQTYGVIDPKTANWDFRVGVTNGNCGTSVGSGTNPANLHPTGRSLLGYDEYELLTTTPITVPKGNVWFDVQPNCTNSSDPDCTNGGRYFLSDTDGLNAINGKFTVTGKTGLGPVGPGCSALCVDGSGICDDGMSAGILK